MKDCCNSCGSGPEERINYQVSFFCECQNEPLWNFNWELTGMIRFLNMVTLHVWDNPNIAGVLAQRITGVLATARTFVSLLSRVLLRDSYSIKIEDVVVTLGVPEDAFIASGKAPFAVQAMLEVPDNSVPQSQFCRFYERGKKGVKQNVQRDHLPVAVDMVPHLPANTPTTARDTYRFLDNAPLEFDIRFDSEIPFVLLPHVVRGRCDHELCRAIWHTPKKLQAVTVKKRHVVRLVEVPSDSHRCTDILAHAGNGSSGIFVWAVSEKG
jgi:hypothetical protein